MSTWEADRALVHRARAGDKDAFGELVLRYRTALRAALAGDELEKHNGG